MALVPPHHVGETEAERLRQRGLWSAAGRGRPGSSADSVDTKWTTA